MSQGRSPFDTGSGASSNRGYAGSGSGWGSSISAGGSNPRTRAGAGHFEATSNVDATNGHISGVQAPARDQDQDRDKEQGEGHGPGAVSVAGPTDWEAAFEARRREEWKQKVQEDLKGWRGGNGPARSAYSRTALPGRSYFNQPVTGSIGAHLPKEIVRIERDWSGGEVCQFETGFPMELEGRITPAQFHTFVTSLNAHLSSAYSLRGAVRDNLLAIASWWTSLWWHTSHFEKELQNAEALIAKTNREVFNPKGLNVLSPRDVALQFLEIE
ncbi:hypothetical protein EHS25_006323 [Saitozyma podzolica]|uniref:Ras modification protein ERF4 n=1 Tax=Saitozyma podzolica TaxID=1890683 RepID=A0A427YRM9_9TREE|nr:hypothetical protein EHS25_006323 [Saitozyma podzolica]